VKWKLIGGVGGGHGAVRNDRGHQTLSSQEGILGEEGVELIMETGYIQHDGSRN
jgi:hypothetical protein